MNYRQARALAAKGTWVGPRGRPGRRSRIVDGRLVLEATGRPWSPSVGELAGAWEEMGPPTIPPWHPFRPRQFAWLRGPGASIVYAVELGLVTLVALVVLALVFFAKVW